MNHYQPAYGPHDQPTYSSRGNWDQSKQLREVGTMIKVYKWDSKQPIFFGGWTGPTTMVGIEGNPKTVMVSYDPRTML